MPRFFYSASNLQSHHTPEPWWRRWRKKTERRRALQKLDTGLVQVGGNPYKKNVTEKPKSNKLGVVLIFVLFVGWIGIMLFLPYFKISKVEYSGLNIIKKEELSEFINSNFLFSKKSFSLTGNYFILSKNKIERKIIENFAVENVSVGKVFPNLIKISIVEKTTSIIYDNGRDYILLDENGNFVKTLKTIPPEEFVTENSAVFSATTTTSTTTATSTAKEELTPTTTDMIVKTHKPNFQLIKKELGTFPIIYDRRIGREEKNNLEKEVVTAVLAWQKLLIGGQAGDIQYFVLDNLAAGLKVKTSKSWDILININGNYQSAYNNLTAIVKDNQPVEYVDLRYGERVYWK